MSAFCSGLFNEISRCCYDFAHAPFTKKNLLIGGGILLGIIIIIIIIVAASAGSKAAGPSAEDLIKEYPLIDGANSLSANLKKLFLDKLSTLKNGLANRTEWAPHCNSCQTDLNSLTAGHVATQVFSVTSSCSAQFKDAVSETLEQIDVIKRLISFSPKKKMALVLQSSDIHKHFQDKKMGVILNVWGGHNIDSRLAVLRMYYDLGVRIMSLVSHDLESNTTCLPAWVDRKSNSLNQFGFEVIDEMNRLGMIIDLTGSPLDLQKSVLNHSKAEVIYSHSGSYSLTNNELNIQDEIIQTHAKQIGLIMVPFTPKQLDVNSSSTLTSVADHLDKLYRLLEKDIKKLGIGSNFDNMIKVTKELEDVSKFINLVSFIKKRKTPKEGIPWNDDDIKKLISINFVKMFENVEKAKNLTEIPKDSIIELQDLTDAHADLNENTTCYSDISLRYPKKKTEKETEAPPKKPDKEPKTPTDKSADKQTDKPKK